MTPSEKAHQLYERFLVLSDKGVRVLDSPQNAYINAKKCVEEICDLDVAWYDESLVDNLVVYPSDTFEFWEKVYKILTAMENSMYAGHVSPQSNA